MWGVGAYWTLVERAAEQMQAETLNPTATLLVSELCSFLGCKRNKLVSFLDHLQNLRGIKYELEKGNAECLRITIPKLAEFADNYAKYDGLSTKRLQRQKEMSSKHRIEVEVDKKEKKNSNIPPAEEEVQALWKERGYELSEAERFYNYYTSNGWRVGKNPMKNWAAAAANWMKNAKELGHGANRQGNTGGRKIFTTADNLSLAAKADQIRGVGGNKP